MERRRLLAGLATAGVTLIAGCSGSGGSNTNGSDGSGSNSNASGGNGGSESGTETGTSLTTGGSETTIATTTAAATTMVETAQQTATTTAMATPMPTAIATSTAPQTTSPPSTDQSTAGGSSGPGMVTGSMNIDLSDHETYTNDTYSYTIEYPAGWSVTDTDPTSVSFTSQNVPASMQVSLTEDAPSSATLDKIIAKFLSGYKQSAKQNNASVKIQNRQQMTLPNGNRAVIFDTQITMDAADVRQTFLFTLVDSTVYMAAITIPEAAYTSTVGKESKEILTSLTISGSSTSS